MEERGGPGGVASPTLVSEEIQTRAGKWQTPSGQRRALPADIEGFLSAGSGRQLTFDSVHAVDRHVIITGSLRTDSSTEPDGTAGQMVPASFSESWIVCVMISWMCPLSPSLTPDARSFLLGFCDSSLTSPSTLTAASQR